MAIGIGISIEPTVVRAVCLEKTRDATRLLGVEEQRFDPTQAEALTRALIALRQALGITQPVFLGLPASAALITTLHPLIVNRERADLAVEFELQQQLPFKIEEAAWHHRWLLSINGQSEVLTAPPKQAIQSTRLLPDITAMVAAVKYQALDERLAVCRRAGLKVASVTIGPIALLNACAMQRNAARAKALTVLNLLDETAAEWILWSAERFQVVPVSAAQPEGLPQELLDSWQSIQSQWPDVSSTISAIGSPAQFEAVQTAFAAVHNAQFQRFDPAQTLVMRSARPETAQRSTAAIGLALQALGASKFSFNVLGKLQESQSVKWIHRASAVVSLVCALAALGLGAGGMVEMHKQKSLMLKAIESREQLYQQLRPEVRLLLQRQQRLERLTAQLQALASSSMAVPAVLSQIAAALPETIWLTRMEVSQNEGFEITLEGRAPSFQEVTKLIDSLKALPGVASVKPLSSAVVPAETGGKETVNFSVQVQRGSPSP